MSRLANAFWRLFTSVNFAVLQIIVLALLAVVGMVIRQLPGFAFRSAGDYAAEMARIHGLYDPILGAGVVGAMERLQLFQVFTSTWFSVGLVVLVVSIVVCTIDRTPRLWRTAADVRVVQPDAYFDPRLRERIRIEGAAAGGSPLEAASVRRIISRHGFRVREHAADDGRHYLYGDRHQWTKLATLLTHTGLILFLLAAAVTSRWGDEQGLVLPEGGTLTVQPIGTPGLLLVRNVAFRAPGLESGRAMDFTTDLVVYRDGELLARKTIRVNDPLAAAGYTFHQNGFGPAPDLLVSDASGRPLWSGPVPLTDVAGERPFGVLAVPGRSVGLQLLLGRDASGVGILLALPYRIAGTNPDGSPIVQTGTPMALAVGETGTSPEIDFTVRLRAFTDYTLLIAKKDPGQGIVWSAFGFLIVGLVVTFHFPRRRVWARLERDGTLHLVGRSDRYVDVDRELGRLVDDLVEARLGQGGARGAAG